MNNVGKKGVCENVVYTTSYHNFHALY